MNNYGLFRVAAASPKVKVADVEYNLSQIIEQINQAEIQGVSLITFPELSLCGFTCADLFGQSILIDSVEKAVSKLLDCSRGKRITIVVGAPVRCRGRLYNSAVVIKNGALCGVVPKIYLPNSNESSELRWFASGSDFLVGERADGQFHNDSKHIYREGFCDEIVIAGHRTTISPNQLFIVGNAVVGCEISEDIWAPIPPSSHLALAGANIIVNLSASSEIIDRHRYRKELLANQSARTISAYVYSSAGFGESTQDLVFGGSSLIYENGIQMAENDRFQMESSLIIADVDLELLNNLRQKNSNFSSVSPDGTLASKYNRLYSTVLMGESQVTDFRAKLYRQINAHPFIHNEENIKEIIDIQTFALVSRLKHIGCKSAVIGISGGLDSTLALLVTVLAFDKLGWSRERIIGLTMPGFGTTDRTHANALKLMDLLMIQRREICIAKSVLQHFEDIAHDVSVHNVTYENAQARERTQILMDVANQEGGIVIGTGDLSELALGWATYNGDHMSMYGVNAGVPKTLVKSLVLWFAHNYATIKDILIDIVDTPISPELTPSDENGNIKQKTEDLVGPYELHDFFLSSFFRFGYSPEKIFFFANKAFDGVYDSETIKKWLKKFISRFFSQQFKRSCLPDGPKIGSVSLSPRGDWKMPSDASSKLWDF